MEHVKNDTAAGDSLKRYVSPRATLSFVKTQEILCQSVTGSFGVSNDGNVKEGDDNVWGENPGW